MTVENGEVIIRPTSGPRDVTSVEDTSSGSLDDIERPAISSASRPVASCLGRIEDKDMQQVRDWIGSLEESST